MALECIFLSPCIDALPRSATLRPWNFDFRVSYFFIFAILADFQRRARFLWEWLSEFTSPMLPHLKKPCSMTQDCVGFLLDTREDVRVKMLTSTQPNIFWLWGIRCKSRGAQKTEVMLAGQGITPLPFHSWKSKPLARWHSEFPSVVMDRFGHQIRRWLKWESVLIQNFWIGRLCLTTVVSQKNTFLVCQTVCCHDGWLFCFHFVTDTSFFSISAF